MLDATKVDDKVYVDFGQTVDLVNKVCEITAQEVMTMAKQAYDRDKNGIIGNPELDKEIKGAFDMLIERTTEAVSMNYGLVVKEKLGEQ